MARIEQDAGGVRVTASQRGETRTFTADRVVVAVPFAVLRSVQFAPALSRDAREAIDQLPNTSVVKVFVQTRTRFWIAEGQSGGASSDLPLSLLSERTINQPGARGILEAYVVGAPARQLCPLSQAERLRVVTADIAKLFPAIGEQYEGGASKCWDEDEWSEAHTRGSSRTDGAVPAGARQGRRAHSFRRRSHIPTSGWMEGASTPPNASSRRSARHEIARARRDSADWSVVSGFSRTVGVQLESPPFKADGGC